MNSVDSETLDKLFLVLLSIYIRIILCIYILDLYPGDGG